MQHDSRTLVSYFLYNERVSEPIITTQVLNLLEDLNRDKGSGLKFKIVIFQNPITAILEWRVIKSFIRDARERQVSVRCYPFALPTRGWLISRLGIRLHQLIFLLSAFLVPPGVVVGRGYLASYLCARSKRRRDWIVVADPRSLFTRENIGNRWSENSAKHKFWQQLEQNMLSMVDLVFVVNNAMKEFYLARLELGSPDKIRLTTIYSRPSPGMSSVHSSGDVIQQSMVKQKIKLIYVGSLGMSGWNNAAAYEAFLGSLAPFFRQLSLTLIVKGLNPAVESFVSNMESLGLEIDLHVSVTPAEVQQLLVLSDVGLMISDEWSDADARTGVKTMEYLAAGLIIWCTRPLTEVATLVEKEDIGFVFAGVCSESNEVTAAIRAVTNNHARMKQRSLRVFNERFNPDDVRAVVVDSIKNAVHQRTYRN